MESPLEPPPLDLEAARNLSRDAAEMMRAGKNESALVLLHNVEHFLRKNKPNMSAGKLAETAYANIGGCYLNLGDVSRAVKYLTKAVNCTIGVQQAPALVNLSFAHYRLGDYETALLETAKAIRLYESAPRSCHEDRMHAKALLVAAMCQEATGHQQKALISYFKALCFAIEKLPPEDDIRESINDRYESLLQHGKQSRKMHGSSPSMPSLHPKLRLQASLRKPRLKADLSTTNKTLKNPILHLKPKKEPSSTRVGMHQRAAFSHDYTFSENTNSESFVDCRQPLSHRLEEYSFSSVFENSDVEGRIVSIEEKLEGLTAKLREYGDRNRLLQLKVDKHSESPSKRSSAGLEPRAKRSLFRVSSLSKTLAKPSPQGKAPSKSSGKGDPRYAMYRLS